MAGEEQTFRLAPMTPLILGLTLLLLALPRALLGGTVIAGRLLLIPALFVFAIYAWV
jgi:hypothetical protein